MSSNAKYSGQVIYFVVLGLTCALLECDRPRRKKTSQDVLLGPDVHDSSALIINAFRFDS